MNHSLIAVRYAKALFKLALEKSLVEQVHTDLKIINEAIKGSKDLNSFLISPVQNKSKKIEIIELLFKKKIQEISYSFLCLLIEKKREEFLQQIIRDFDDLYRKSKNIRNVAFISAMDVDKVLQPVIRKTVEDALKSKIELTYRQDSKLIGGFIITVDGKLMDASVLSKLNNIKKQLLN